MFEAFRERMGRRALKAAVRSRTARGMSSDPSGRSVLILLPDDEDGLRATWPFVEALDVPMKNLTCVVVSERVAYAPDQFAGSVQRITRADLDWRGLPRAEVLASLHGTADVAINLADPNDLAATFLIGTSSAAVRIGQHGPATEPFYDLMLAGAQSASELVGALRRALARIEPPILPVS
ncbi:MAG: hypothetical protein Rubg2KO_19210 [Rubricoccaceae bacterium]